MSVDCCLHFEVFSEIFMCVWGLLCSIIAKETSSVDGCCRMANASFHSLWHFHFFSLLIYIALLLKYKNRRERGKSAFLTAILYCNMEPTTEHHSKKEPIQTFCCCCCSSCCDKTQFFPKLFLRLDSIIRQKN